MKRAVPRVMQKVEASGAMRWLASLFKVRSFPDPSIKFPPAPKGSMASRGGVPVAPAGNNARAAVPEGPSESLTMSGLRLVTPRSESLGSFPWGCRSS
jgi:hypothetical protein